MMTIAQSCVVGLIGYKQHGKGEVAKILARSGYKQVKFADPLKAALRAILASAGVDADTIERMIEGDLKELPTPILGDRSPRYAMVTLGTEWGRGLMASDLWIRIARAKITSVLRTGNVVVLDDCRFPNEADLIRNECSGSIIHVHRPGHPVDLSHESERHVGALAQMADACIVNDGSLLDLERNTSEALTKLIAGKLQVTT